MVLCVSAILTYSASGCVIRHTLYYDSGVVIGQFYQLQYVCKCVTWIVLLHYDSFVMIGQFVSLNYVCKYATWIVHVHYDSFCRWLVGFYQTMQCHLVLPDHVTGSSFTFKRIFYTIITVSVGRYDDIFTGKTKSIFPEALRGPMGI